MKKGFTVVEILAVVVILAVISLVITPVVISYIDESKHEAFENGAKNVLDTAKIYITKFEENGDLPEEGIKVEILKEELKNYNYVSGYIYRNSEGSIYLDGLSDGIYCATGTKSDLKIVKGNCEEIDTTPPVLNLTVNNVTSTRARIIVDAKDLQSGIEGMSCKYLIGNSTTSRNCNVEDGVINIEGLPINTEVKLTVKVFNRSHYGNNNSTEKSITFKTLSVDKPEFKISSSGNDTTTTVKVLTIKYPKSKDNTNYMYFYKFENSEEYIVNEDSIDITLTENCKVIAYVRDAVSGDNLSENYIVISGFDNEGPIAEITYDEAWSKTKEVKIKITSDTSELPVTAFSLDYGKTWNKGNVNSSEYTFNATEGYRKFGKGQIQVRDKLGNITTRFKVNGSNTDELVIEFIDNIPPTCNIVVKDGKKTSEENEWYISNVTVEMTDMKDEALNSSGQNIPGSGIKNFKLDSDGAVSKLESSTNNTENKPQDTNTKNYKIHCVNGTCYKTNGTFEITKNYLCDKEYGDEYVCNKSGQTTISDSYNNTEIVYKESCSLRNSKYKKSRKCRYIGYEGKPKGSYEVVVVDILNDSNINPNDDIIFDSSVNSSNYYEIECINGKCTKYVPNSLENKSGLILKNGVFYRKTQFKEENLVVTPKKQSGENQEQKEEKIKELTITKNTEGITIKGEVEDNAGNIGKCELTIKKDSIKPVIKAKKDPLTKFANSTYQFKNNIEVTKSGLSGGTITCDPASNHKLGIYPVTCSYKAGNGFSNEVKFIANIHYIANKTPAAFSNKPASVDASSQAATKSCAKYEKRCTKQEQCCTASQGPNCNCNHQTGVCTPNTTCCKEEKNVCVSDKYECPSGWTKNGTTCYKCNSGTLSGTKCTFSCPAGTTEINGKCYSCPHGGILNGTYCYSCPYGGTLSGENCVFNSSNNSTGPIYGNTTIR